MRHAKSSWDDESLSDHDRPLNQRGLADAPRMARFLRDQNLVPDLILSSSANRAQTTAKIVCQELKLDGSRLEIVDDFYHAQAEVYTEFVSRLSEQYTRPMVVGHNPGLEHLVHVLTNANEFMATAAVAFVRFGFDSWQDILDATPNPENLVSIFRPKEVL